MKNYLSILLSLLVLGCTTLRPKTMDQFQETSVLIKSDSGGGGSGVIYKSSPKGTVILTNRHICESIAGGGTVVDYKRHPILAFKKSPTHDICYIFIKADLALDTVISKRSPKINDKLYISGHPSLYPHIVSQGYLAGNEDFPIHMDDRDCTAEEKKKDPIECILDGHPKYVTLESNVVSALISPGSSGSAVFNEDGEIVGLAFAAQGDIGYALVVPWKFLNRFVAKEAKTLKWEKPDPTKKRRKYDNKGIYDLKNWEEILKLINEKNQCLRLCP